MNCAAYRPAVSGHTIDNPFAKTPNFKRAIQQRIFFTKIWFYSLSHLKFIDKSLEIIKSLEKKYFTCFSGHRKSWKIKNLDFFWPITKKLSLKSKNVKYKTCAKWPQKHKKIIKITKIFFYYTAIFFCPLAKKLQ